MFNKIGKVFGSRDIYLEKYLRSTHRCNFRHSFDLIVKVMLMKYYKMCRNQHLLNRSSSLRCKHYKFDFSLQIIQMGNYQYRSYYQLIQEDSYKMNINTVKSIVNKVISSLSTYLHQYSHNNHHHMMKRTTGLTTEVLESIHHKNYMTMQLNRTSYMEISMVNIYC